MNICIMHLYVSILTHTDCFTYMAFFLYFGKLKKSLSLFSQDIVLIQILATYGSTSLQSKFRMEFAIYPYIYLTSLPLHQHLHLFLPSKTETPNNLCPSRFFKVCSHFPFLQNANLHRKRV